MKTRLASILLTMALAMGLTVPALAYETPDFSDVSAGHWAYGNIMRMADAGYIKGTGNGAFSPMETVSAAQFLTLVGRAIFPEVTVEESDAWYGPYMTAADDAGLLDDTSITLANPEAEISRYDMAVVLAKAAIRLGAEETPAQEADVSDFGDIPNKYTSAVLVVYGAGLITGDESGRFNGSQSMSRAEMATVLDRLTSLAEKQAQAKREAEAAHAAAEAQAQAEAQAAFEASRTGEYVTVTFHGYVAGSLSGVNVGIYFRDGRLLGQTVSDNNGHGDWSVDITMDKADYSLTEPLYYTAVIGQVDDGYGELVETKDFQKIPQALTTGGYYNTFVTGVVPLSFEL